MLIETLLQKCDAAAAERGISESRLSTILFNDGKRLGALRAGGDLNTRTWEQAMNALGEAGGRCPCCAQALAPAA